jgi:hypothetical protein
MVNVYGERKWAAVAQHLPGRIGKQCRERWTNHLRPDIDKVPIHRSIPLFSFKFLLDLEFLDAWMLEVMSCVADFGER